MEAFGYRIVRALRHGERSEVVLAESLSTGEKQAWKVLKTECASDPERLGRFMDEAFIYRQVRHPNIVRDLGAGRLPDGRLYLALELLEGLTLRACIRATGPLTLEDALRVFIPLCEALAHIHERGVIHRDIRPANIFLCDGLTAGRPKLIDFGCAYFPGTKSVETLAGTLLSQPEYAAPERIQGHRGDERSDLYALGATLYEALTGSPPFVAGSVEGVLAGHLHEEPRPLPLASGHLQPVINQCLAKNPNHRFPSARELLRRLEEFGVLPVAQSRAAPVPEPCAEKAGDVLGKYELVRQLGSGGMARVWLARHTTLGREVALKVLLPEQAERRELVERFFQEARAVNRVRHPHIVEIFDFVSEALPNGQRRSYCVMEALDGRTLRSELRRGPLLLQQIFGIAGQACSALAAAHEVGVIHRDIKPENIFLLSNADAVKLLDFGVAKLQGDAELIIKTLNGCVVGTPTYMAPEQVQGHPVDARTDIYSLGTVLYELLAGREPFRAPGLKELGPMICSELPPPLPDATPDGERIPAGLAKVVVRCLEKKPSSRYQSMESLSAALRAVAREPHPAAAAARETRRQAPKRRKSTIALAGAAAVGVVLAVGWVSRSRSAAPIPKARAPVAERVPLPAAVPPPPAAPAPLTGAPTEASEWTQMLARLAPKPKTRGKAPVADHPPKAAPRPTVPPDDLLDPYAP